MSNMIRCDAQTTRRLVEQEAGHVKNVDLDKLDNCGEVTLGLTATFGCALIIWIVCLPFFDLVTLGWIKTWERHVGHVDMAEFKENLFANTPSDHATNNIFEKMDKTQDGFVDINEMRVFLGNMSTPITKEEQVNFVFQGLDENGDDVLTADEWNYGLSQTEFFYWERPTSTLTVTTTTPAAPPQAEAPGLGSGSSRPSAQAASSLAPAGPKPAMRKPAAPQPEAKPQPAAHKPKAEPSHVHAKIEKPQAPPTYKDHVSMANLINRLGPNGHGTPSHALKTFDSDGDDVAAHDEFISGLGQLPQPVKGPAAEGVFQSLDLNQDNVVESQEWANAFNQKHYVKKPQAHKATVVANEARKQQVLKDMGLSSEPLQISQFAQGMGSVTPETAFQALDANQNGAITEDEMVRFAGAFVPPLTEAQAKYAQKGLDVNGDHRVVPAEMYDTLKFGDFFPTEAEARGESQ
mmetsp:Transcript_33183/g.76656  ORF Transcript_33183/g.76656 Transcript_33183/m.76656 type:complete len:463 (-) Transcript_33183:93-1481(-)